MTAAIHISTGKNESIHNNFLFSLFSSFAVLQPLDHFIFIFDKQPPPELTLESNCTPVICGPQIKNSLIRYYWYNNKLPGILEKYNAGIFITGGIITSLQTDVPQVIILNNISQHRLASIYLKKYIRIYLKKAAIVFVSDPLLSDELLKYNITKPARFFHLPSYISFPETFEKKQIIKDNYNDGKDYFLCKMEKITLQEFLILLKAFSIFKKWHRSEMQLILVSEAGPENDILNSLSTYKYKHQIRIIQKEQADLNLLVSAAYAFINTDTGRNFPFAIINSMTKGVPVISSESIFLKKLLGEAILYCEFNSEKISACMISLYKDEYTRNNLIAKGLKAGNEFSINNTVSEIWSALEQTAKD